MCRCANSAIQIAALGTENVRFHWRNPAAFMPPPPSLPAPPPGMTAARPLLPCALPSHTERKHSTWFARPAPTAIHALMTEPSCPDVSSPPLYQPQLSRNASIISYAPAPVNPGGTPPALP